MGIEHENRVNSNGATTNPQCGDSCDRFTGSRAGAINEVAKIISRSRLTRVEHEDSYSVVSCWTGLVRKRERDGIARNAVSPAAAETANAEKEQPEVAIP